MSCKQRKEGIRGFVPGIAIVAVLASSAAAMQTQDGPKRAPCEHQSLGNTHRHGVADAKHTTSLERLRHYAHCARTESKAQRIRAIIEQVKEERAEAKAEAASLTPYPGPNGTHWAIPWSIVSCESGGSWTAANPSGAIGPYQLLGWGAPWPVTSEADKLAHHRIAARVWAGGAGRSNWVC